MPVRRLRRKAALVRGHWFSQNVHIDFGHVDFGHVCFVYVCFVYVYFEAILSLAG